MRTFTFIEDMRRVYREADGEAFKRALAHAMLDDAAWLERWMRDAHVTKSPLIDRGPGVDPATQERTYSDALAAFDSLRENDVVELGMGVGDSTPIDRALERVHARFKGGLDALPTAIAEWGDTDVEFWNAFQYERWLAITGRHSHRDCTVHDPGLIHGFRTRIERATLRHSPKRGLASIVLDTSVLGTNEHYDPELDARIAEAGTRRIQRHRIANAQGVDIGGGGVFHPKVATHVHTDVEYASPEADLIAPSLVTGRAEDEIRNATVYEDVVLAGDRWVSAMYDRDPATGLVIEDEPSAQIYTPR